MSIITVPRRLHNPHRLLRATREQLTGQRLEADGRFALRPRYGTVQLHVSRRQLGRALRILQGIFTEVERRGWQALPVERRYAEPPGVAIVIGQHSYGVKVTELTDRIPLSESEVARWGRENRSKVEWSGARPPTHRPVASGRLNLTCRARYGRGRRSNWADGPRGSLEHKLSSVFSELEGRAEADDRFAVEAARTRAQFDRERAEHARRAELTRIDRARAAQLLREVASRQQAREVRDYARALRATLPEVREQDRERIASWCNWAMEWVDRSDPVLNSDSLVGLAGGA